jgi:hypothetical protein
MAARAHWFEDEEPADGAVAEDDEKDDANDNGAGKVEAGEEDKK